ncbi:BON domain-containing protein [candidate division KSB1 bacterium]|nr:BON domain-containing protein [candidate division KSB1 bacterium]
MQIKQEEKMFRNIILIFSLSMVFISSGFVAEEVSDRDIIFAVETELLVDEQVASHLIDVNCIDGIVNLSGSVDNILAKGRAEKIAATVRGVRSVVNQIEVKPKEITESELQETIQKALLQDPATNSYQIQTSVSEAKITLQGNVHSYQEKELAEKVVKSVSGVKKVDNLISVDYQAERNDFEIEQDILARLKYDMWVDEALIDVAVEDGKVKLKGTVGSEREKRRALSDAWVMGTNLVDAEDLKVQWWADDEIKKEVTPLPPSDQEIKNAVKDALYYDPRLASFNIDVQLNKGQVILSGIVDNLKAKMAAENDAENAIGVWEVKNHIRVRPDTIPSDEVLKSRVKSALLRNSYIELYDITVTVVNGRVFLSGDVNTSFEKKRAKSVTSGVEGVVDVVNNIDYQHVWTWKSDWMIKRDIESQYYWSPVIESDNITLTVENGVVTLTGKVDTWNERRAAERNAYEGGAKDVRNRLKIKDWDPYSDFYPHSF